MPGRIARVLARLELTLYMQAYRAGFGTDDAVTADLQREPALFAPLLLHYATQLPDTSRKKADALHHLILYLDQEAIRESLLKYARSGASPDFRAKIDNVFELWKRHVSRP